MARKPLRDIIIALTALSTAACGSGGSGGSTPPTSGGGTPPPPSSSGCALSVRQNWAFGVLNEWYLFPETLPASLDPSPYTTVEAYIDALTATARSQRRDRFFTYITSIAEENAFFASGSSAGFGIRLSVDATARRAFVAEAFEGAPALAAGMDRGTEILAIGATAGSLRTVSDIIAAEGAGGVSAALGPSTVGLSRALQITDAGGTRTITVSKANFDLPPVSSRYGALTLDDAGQKVGYINLRTFISTADGQLRNAFSNFRAQGVTRFIIDFRYNGGGLVSTAELMNNLLGGNRSASDIMSVTTFRSTKSGENETERFSPQSQSVSPTRIAFITTGSSASASELVANTFIPYLGANVALVGANSFGKPVGQIALDRTACDDRLRVVAFSTQNAANGGFYYDGLASVFPRTCAAADDITRPLGDPQEASVKAALDFVAGRSCTAISVAGKDTVSAEGGTKGGPRLVTAEKPTAAQREVPGLF